MSGASPKTIAAREAFNTAGNLEARAYDIAVPSVKKRGDFLRDALSQGEFGFLGEALNASRASVGDLAATQQRSALAETRGGARDAAGGGNFGAQQLDPIGYGAKLAESMYSSRINQALTNVEQMDKTLGFMTGVGQEAGSAGLQAFANQFAGMEHMQNYNSTYANVLGALNAGGALYGAGRQAGWFNTNRTQGQFGGVTQSGQPYVQYSGGVSPGSFSGGMA